MIRLIYIIGITNTNDGESKESEASKPHVFSHGKYSQTPQPCSPSPDSPVQRVEFFRLTFSPFLCLPSGFTDRRGGTGGSGMAVGCWWSGGWIVGVVVVGEWVSGRWVMGGQCL